MILAAGRGERMRPLSDARPKPLLVVGGKALIVWQIERLAAAGIRELVINHAHLGAQIEAELGDGRRHGVHIAYSPETEALETAGGVIQALHLLGSEPFLVVSADIYCECDYRPLLQHAAQLTESRLAHLWLVDNRPWHPRGDFALRDGLLYATGEARLTYSNIGVYHPDFFTGVAPGTRLALRPLLDRAIAAGKITGDHLDAVWDNIGTPAQLTELNADLDRRCAQTSHH